MTEILIGLVFTMLMGGDASNPTASVCYPTP